MNRYIAIMAGGVGSRFWPSSTEDRPKQFLDILGIGKSLLRMTFERCRELVPDQNILVVTNKKYKGLVMQHLPELAEQNVLCEPSMNNTGPCVAYAALHIQAVDPQAVFAVLASDHIILKEDEYLKVLDKAFTFAETHEALVTLGIEPTRPDTGYGYINYNTEAIKGGYSGVYKVRSFKEKPDAVTARAYVDSGEYLWNAGMFVWSVKSILGAFEKYSQQILQTLSRDTKKYNTPEEQAYIDEVYPATEKISIDYAILERADEVYTLPADIGWSDLGTWNSLHAYLSEGKDTVTIGKNIRLIDCRDTMVVSNNDKTIVIKGLDDYIVVDEENALLIYPKSQEQEIRKVVADLKV